MKTYMGLMGLVTFVGLIMMCMLMASCVMSFGGDPVDTGPNPHPELDLPVASSFSCDGLDGSEVMCVDFNDDTNPGFDAEGGEWELVDGRFVGWGPEVTAGSCPESLMTHALVPDIEAQDLTIRAELAALERVDKVIALRSLDQGNRVQINFRAHDEDGDYGDLMVQEMKDCQLVEHTADGEVSIPHEIGEKLDVEIDLVGAHVTVRMNNSVVFDREVPLAVRSGRVGLGVIESSTAMFDDLVMISHDPE